MSSGSTKKILARYTLGGMGVHEFVYSYGGRGVHKIDCGFILEDNNTYYGHHYVGCGGHQLLDSYL